MSPLPRSNHVISNLTKCSVLPTRRFNKTGINTRPAVTAVAFETDLVTMADPFKLIGLQLTARRETTPRADNCDHGGPRREIPVTQLTVCCLMKSFTMFRLDLFACRCGGALCLILRRFHRYVGCFVEEYLSTLFVCLLVYGSLFLFFSFTSYVYVILRNVRNMTKQRPVFLFVFFTEFSARAALAIEKC